MIVGSGDLVPKQDTALARSTTDLVSRGLQLVDPSAQREVFISETQCIVLRTRYHEALRRMGRLREEIHDYLESRVSLDIVSGDLNEFLEAFDRVKLNEGYVLDYVVDCGQPFGGPLIYTREVDSEPLSSPEEYRDAFGLPRICIHAALKPTCADSLPYLRHMRFDRTATAYFQFALFCMTVRYFYQFQCSGNNLRYTIFTDSDLRDCLENRIGDLSDADRLRLLKLNLNPRVRLRDDSAEVTMLCWQINRGYSYLHTYIQWPNGFEKTEDEIVAESRWLRVD